MTVTWKADMEKPEKPKGLDRPSSKWDSKYLDLLSTKTDELTDELKGLEQVFEEYHQITGKNEKEFLKEIEIQSEYNYVNESTYLEVSVNLQGPKPQCLIDKEEKEFRQNIEKFKQDLLVYEEKLALYEERQKIKQIDIDEQNKEARRKLFESLKQEFQE